MQRQRRRPHRANPPRPQPVHQELRIRHGTDQPKQTPNNCQQRPFSDEESSNPRIRKPDRLQRPNFPRALLDPEFKKQSRQHQRRDDEKETEIQKILTKICRAARGSQTLLAHRHDLHTHQRRIDLLAQLFAEAIHHLRCGFDANRSEFAETCSP